MGVLIIVLILGPVLVYGSFFMTYPDEYEFAEIEEDYPTPPPHPPPDPDCFFHNCMYMNPNECCQDHNVNCPGQFPDKQYCRGIEFCKRAQITTIKHWHGANRRLEWWRYCFHFHNISIPVEPQMVSECNNQKMEHEMERRLCCLAANVCKPLEPRDGIPDFCLNLTCLTLDAWCCTQYNEGCFLPMCDREGPVPHVCEGKGTSCHSYMHNWGQCCEFHGECDVPLCEGCDIC